MKEHQVIIVGGGPAGSACARALVDEGIDVLVIERHKLPRYKCCSGVLFGQTQILLEKYFGGMPPGEVYCEPRIINADSVREWNRKDGYKRYIWEIDKDGQSFPRDYYNIWRNRFDLWLLEQSRATFVDNCSLEGFEAGGDRVTVVVRRDDPDGGEAIEENLSCRYLVGADGGSSKVRRILDPAWVHEGADAEVVIHQSYCVIEDMGDLKEDGWTVFFEPDIGEMLSCVHRKDDQLALCVGGFRGRHLLESVETFKTFLSEHFGVATGERQRTEGCRIRLAPPTLGSGRVILTGEAAGHMYLNGEGISAAMDAGYRAGKAIALGLDENVKVQDVYSETLGDIHDHVDKCLREIHFLSV
jgi:flavin-dependent dehydrogenase